MFSAFIILVGIAAMILSTAISTVIAFWLIMKALDFIFGK